VARSSWTRLIHIGTAGWSISSRHGSEFCSYGTQLERYSSSLLATEINSSFYRSHQRQTYMRWSESVPAEFVFAVKAPRALTHLGGLAANQGVIERFSTDIGGLGRKLRVVLVQMPPSLAFEAISAAVFFKRLRAALEVQLVCEPRHPTWDCAEADALLTQFSVARVAADPPRFTGGDVPGGSAAASYFRMHGSPQIYHSDYDPERLSVLARELRRAEERSSDVWCIFDNTASGCAVANALALLRLQARDHEVARDYAVLS
jgi:uncharacterized protein YecE (DUF72 family)